MAKLFPNNEIQYVSDKILEEKSEADTEVTKNNSLLNTIYVPQNLSQLTKKLPKSNYAVATTKPLRNSMLNPLPRADEKLKGG